MNLKEYTTEQLEAELKTRKDCPKLLEHPNWTNVISMGKYRVEQISSEKFHEDNDDKQYIFEEVMKALYGKDYFQWENSNT